MHHAVVESKNWAVVNGMKRQLDIVYISLPQIVNIYSYLWITNQ